MPKYKWDLLASNGGFGEYEKPEPYNGTKEYDAPKQFESYPGESPADNSGHKIEASRNPQPWMRGLPIVSRMSSDYDYLVDQA